MTLRTIAPALAILALLPGCRFGQLPNPNAKRPTDKYDGKALQARVLEYNQDLAAREFRGMLDAQTRKRLIEDFVNRELEGIEIDRIPVDQAWRFGDVFRQSGDWEKTKDLYEIAAANAKDDDRRANDTIRLAEAYAMLGEVEKGIELVRSTFDVKPGNKAPILLASLYEFAPAALDKGHDLSVALLLEDAIDQHFLASVDPDSEPGQAFIASRRHHVSEAWRLVLQILKSHGTEEQIRAGLERADRTLGRFVRA